MLKGNCCRCGKMTHSFYDIVSYEGCRATVRICAKCFPHLLNDKQKEGMTVLGVSSKIGTKAKAYLVWEFGKVPVIFYFYKIDYARIPQKMWTLTCEMLKGKHRV